MPYVDPEQRRAWARRYYRAWNRSHRASINATNRKRYATNDAARLKRLTANEARRAATRGTVLGICRQKMSTLRSNAKRRAIAISIDAAYLKALWDAQDGRCALTGWQLAYSLEHTPRSPSVDRITVSRGYVPGNVRWLCYQANSARMSWDDEQLRALCRAVLGQEA